MSLSLFRDHPRGLLTCAATEMWERFSYYGMRALLVFYLTQRLGFSDRDSFAIYGAYTALVYLAPVFGGAIADRWLGGRKAVRLGGGLLVAGHFGMALEGPLHLFFLSLALIVTGVGFLKTSTNTIVGALYEPHDGRRDSGFTMYYMAYNVGGAAAPLLCGWLGQTYGWRYGFGLAGIGMVAGLVVFLRGQRHLLGRAEPPDPAALRARVAGLPREALIYLASLGLVALVWLLLLRRELVGPLLLVIGAGMAAWVVWYAYARCSRDERRRLLVCAVLIGFTLGFWAFYEQMGSSLNLFADRVVDRAVLGREIPASTLQSLPSIFVILLAPGFSALWLRLARQGREPGTAAKFALAIGQLALAFLVLALGAALTRGDARVPLIWFALNFLLLVTGELCLAPVGISMVTRLAPARIVGVMMGGFLLAYSASSYLAGLIARLTSVTGPAGGALDLMAARATYGGVFLRLGIAALVVAALLALLAPLLERRAGTG
jgi:POT family proton-dependent oligopeptide transporter